MTSTTTKIAPAPSESMGGGKADTHAIRAKNAIAISATRRIVRTTAFIVALLILWVAYLIFCLPYLTFAETRAYEPADGLWITTDGCDIEFRPGFAAEVEYRVWSSGISIKWKNGISGRAYDVSASNKAGCERTPLRECRTACTMLVTVPPAASAATFRLRQVGGDSGWPVIRVLPGTVLGSVRVGEWYARLPTASVDIEDATVGSLQAYLSSGRLDVRNSTVGSVYFESTASGSAYLLDVDTGASDVELTYRQPASQVCLAYADDSGSPTTPSDAANVASWVPDPDPFKNCNFRSLVNDSNQVDLNAHPAWYYVTLLRGNYDEDGDQAVTKSEFDAGLSKLTCCGGACPFSSWCESQSFEAGFGLGFGGTSSGQTTDRITTRQLANNILATANAHWVPKCMSSIALRHTAPSPTRPSALTLGYHLHSEHGEVAVTLRGQESVDPAAPRTPSLLPPVANLSTFSPPRKLSGLRMLRTDAERMMSTYGADYGDRDAEKHVVVIIDVAETVHVPASRWIFATRNVYLEVCVRARREAARLTQLGPLRRRQTEPSTHRALNRPLTTALSRPCSKLCSMTPPPPLSPPPSSSHVPLTPPCSASRSCTRLCSHSSLPACSRLWSSASACASPTAAAASPRRT